MWKGGPVSHRVQIMLVAISLLAIWLVFFAWPPVRPLAVFEPARASATQRSESDVDGIERAEEPDEAAVQTVFVEPATQRAGAPERVELHVASKTQAVLVRVHGYVTRRGLPVHDFDLLFQVVGTGLDEWYEWEFTDHDGAFEVLLEPGSYLVRGDDGGPWITNVVIHAGATEQALDIRLPCGIVRGRVVQADAGTAVSNAKVFGLRSTDGHGPSDALTQGLMARGGETNTRRDGSFELVDLRPGDYLVVAERENLLTAPVHVVVTDAPLEDLVLSFEPGHTLKGVVLGPGNEPVAMELQLLPGTNVTSLTQLEMSGVHYSNYEGEFVIEGIQPGPYVVVGRGETRTHDFALQVAIDFHPDAGPIELDAQRCGELVVTILSPDGTPVPGAHVDLRAHDGSVVLGSLEWLEEGPVSDDEGRIELDDVLPGWYRIAVGTDGRLGTPLPAEVRAEETTRLELVLD